MVIHYDTVLHLIGKYFTLNIESSKLNCWTKHKDQEKETY